MILEQMNWTPSNGWLSEVSTNAAEFLPQVVLIFGSRQALSDKERLNDVRKKYPSAQLMGCSTSGEILGTSVLDDSLAVTAIHFEKSLIKSSFLEIDTPSDSYAAAEKLASSLFDETLRHVFILSDGLNVNGTELVRGFRKALPETISLTGGLAGDGSDFTTTCVIDADGVPRSNRISAIGLYGSELEIGYGSFGGWDSFGIDRKITRSKENVLFEIDGTPALELYKSFLGEKASELPGSGLLFPLSLRTESDQMPVVRTILAVNEEDQSITFAGDMPNGGFVKFMKANIDRLINGAIKAAEISMQSESRSPELAILISCVGRKLVLKQLVEEEVEAARDILGKDTVITGFYSYGEISPFSNGAQCELHNQTMTITTFSER
jgi:hypothetical protein